MKFDPVRRRFFLAGAGALVALPFLPSLTRTARATSARPVRYVQLFSPYSVTAGQFSGALTLAEQIEPNVGVRRLSEVEGDISVIFGPQFTPLREKFSLLRGMDTIVENANHNMAFASCASGYAAGLDGELHPPISGQPSVDVMMATSSRVYDADTPLARRLLVLNPLDTDSYTRTRSFSWQATPSGAIEMIQPTKTTIGLTDILATGFGEAQETGTEDERLLNAVYEDYRRTRDGSRISTEDRARLEAYMALLQDATRGSAACAMPELADESDVDVLITNQFRLLTAAMLCDLTRVASVTLGMSEAYSVRHTEHHDRIATSAGAETGLLADYIANGRRIAALLQMFEEASDLDGSLLDNSIVYWATQYGNARPADAHRAHNIPAMVAGRAGGRLQSGYFVDYRKDGHLSADEPRGIPINNLLVTFMNCMGLSSADYEPEGRAGYGYYNTAFFERTTRADTEFWSSTEGRRSPLPFLYTGTRMG